MATLTTLLCKIYQTAPNFPPKNKMLLGRRTRRRATILTQETACQTMQISKSTAKSWHAKSTIGFPELLDMFSVLIYFVFFHDVLYSAFMTHRFLDYHS